MRLIDLSSPVDERFWEPEPVSVQTMSAAEGARHVSAEMHEHFGMIIDPSVFRTANPHQRHRRANHPIPGRTSTRPQADTSRRLTSALLATTQVVTDGIRRS